MKKILQAMVLSIIILIILACICTPPQPGHKQVSATWDHAATSAIITVIHNIGHPGGIGHDGFGPNYIPHARLWGDGSITWTSFSNGEFGQRSVYQGKLNEQEMETLIKKVIDTGFFDWDAYYISLLPYDNPPSNKLAVNLKENQHTVFVGFGEPPQGFTDLIALMKNGAGASAKKFTPTSAELKVAWRSTEKVEADLSCEKDGITIDPASLVVKQPAGTQSPESYRTATIEGKDLDLIWNAINKNSINYLKLACGGETYSVSLHIPGITEGNPY